MSDSAHSDSLDYPASRTLLWLVSEAANGFARLNIVYVAVEETVSLWVNVGHEVVIENRMAIELDEVVENARVIDREEGNRRDIDEGCVEVERWMDCLDGDGVGVKLHHVGDEVVNQMVLDDVEVSLDHLDDDVVACPNHPFVVFPRLSLSTLPVAYTQSDAFDQHTQITHLLYSSLLLNLSFSSHSFFRFSSSLSFFNAISILSFSLSSLAASLAARSSSVSR